MVYVIVKTVLFLSLNWDEIELLCIQTIEHFELSFKKTIKYISHFSSYL